MKTTLLWKGPDQQVFFLSRAECFLDLSHENRGEEGGGVLNDFIQIVEGEPVILFR
jgi:hypothetical protein